MGMLTQKSLQYIYKEDTSHWVVGGGLFKCMLSDMYWVQRLKIMFFPLKRFVVFGSGPGMYLYINQFSFLVSPVVYLFNQSSLVTVLISCLFFFFFLETWCTWLFLSSLNLSTFSLSVMLDWPGMYYLIIIALWCILQLVLLYSPALFSRFPAPTEQTISQWG